MTKFWRNFVFNQEMKSKMQSATGELNIDVGKHVLAMFLN